MRTFISKTILAHFIIKINNIFTLLIFYSLNHTKCAYLVVLYKNVDFILHIINKELIFFKT